MNQDTLTDASFPQHFLSSQDFLSDLMPLLPHTASLKDIQTGKYLLTNETTVKLCGLNNLNHLIGLTIRDFADFMQSRWDTNYGNRIEALDAQIKIQPQKLYDKAHAWLTTEGFVRIQDTTKIPVLNNRQKAVAIFTFSYDRTRDTPWEELFTLYKKFAANKSSAIQYFLKFLRIDHHFLTQPTEAELYTLITMKQRHSQKRVADKLGIQPKTVETHIRHLSNKLTTGCFYKLLEDLRNDSSNRPH